MVLLRVFTSLFAADDQDESRDAATTIGSAFRLDRT